MATVTTQSLRSEVEFHEEVLNLKHIREKLHEFRDARDCRVQAHKSIGACIAEGCGLEKGQIPLGDPKCTNNSQTIPIYKLGSKHDKLAVSAITQEITEKNSENIKVHEYKDKFMLEFRDVYTASGVYRHLLGREAINARDWGTAGITMLCPLRRKKTRKIINKY